MAAYNLSPVANGVQFFTNGGIPLAGGKIYTYAAGTTTAQYAYTYSAGSYTATTNPILLDSTGRLQAEIYFPAGVGYKFVVQDVTGNQIGVTLDNLYGVNDSSALTVTEWQSSGFTPIYGGTSTFSTTANSTGTFIVGRRIQATVTAGTVYGTISSVSGTGPTTVNLTMDPGMVLDSGLTVVNVGFTGTTTHSSSPGILPYPLSVTQLTSSGAVSGTTITASTQFSGPGTGLTGTASSLAAGTAANLTGSSPTLGTNWNVDANGQLTNNGNTTYFAAYYNNATIATGTVVTMNTLIGQQGSNFSLSSGAIVSAAAGLYEVQYSFGLADPNVSNTTFGFWFTASAGTVYGPNSSSIKQYLVVPGASGGVDMSGTFKCYWQATAGANIQLNCDTTFGGATYYVWSNAMATIKRIG